jgi:hypothetical protein
MHISADQLQMYKQSTCINTFKLRLPNGATIASTHTATLNMPSLPRAASQAHILPGLAQHSLLYVGQICDSGCAVTFTATKVTVTNGESKILTGLRDKESSLWLAPLEPDLPL